MADNKMSFDENEGVLTLTTADGKQAYFSFYEDSIVPLEDDDGNVTEYECIATMEYEDNMYYALLPTGDEEPEEFVVLKGEETEEQILFTTIDDDDEYQKIGDLFLTALLPDEDDDGLVQ